MADDTPRHVRAMLESLDFDLEEHDELAETPDRFADMLETMFRGVDEPAPEVSTISVDTTASDPDAPEPVILTGLPFYSMCIHHLVPFFGTIDIAYRPADSVTGFGSVGRVIDHYAHRPQLQERLVEQIASHLDEALDPKGILVRCRARQMCMELRGAQKTGRIVSVASRGCLRDGAERRDLMNSFRAEQDSP